MSSRMLMALLLMLLVGCETKSEKNQLEKSAQQFQSEKLEEVLATISNTVEPQDWSDVGGSGTVSGTDFQSGDLAPCPMNSANYLLSIEAKHDDRVFYIFQQGFRVYDETFDPLKADGMQFQITVCALLTTGFANGTFQYVELSPESVTVDIDWKASHKEDEQLFTSKFTLRPDEAGIVDAGNGNQFVWSFKTLKQ